MVVLIEVVALNDLRHNLPDLGKQHRLLVLKAFDEELIANDVTIGVIFVACLKFTIQSYSLYSKELTISGVYLLTLSPSTPSSLADSSLLFYLCCSSRV
jgi:predicted Na+-dependent transporter